MHSPGMEEVIDEEVTGDLDWHRHFTKSTAHVR